MHLLLPFLLLPRSKSKHCGFFCIINDNQQRRGDVFNFNIVTSSCKTISVLSLLIFLPFLFYNQTSPTALDYRGSDPTIPSLDGLLPLRFDEQSCESRYESHLYRKPSLHKPSIHLLSKLRSYEQLHRSCGPNSIQYNITVKNLAKRDWNTVECNYVVWFPANGLGNRMLSLAATFLYALLTDRVLLVAFEAEMSGLFCEPFVNSTWSLPRDFPHRYQINDLPTYETLMKNLSGIYVPPFLFVDLQHHGPDRELFFHCGESQKILSRVPFLLFRSDQYFVPSLFMIPSFQEELTTMFPEKDTVFHHLGRYLFLPENKVWKQIKLFYTDKLSKADKKVGIQVRVFSPKLTPAKTVTEQTLACASKNNILPDLMTKNWNESLTAVLVTSLNIDYSENLRAIYKTAGEAVQVYQPSHEETQRMYNNSHNVKALTEMYLLSLCDELVTSGRSTFGYVAQGLGAKKALIMYKPRGLKFRDPPCEKGLSMEPCFHYPPKYDCERRIEVQHMSLVFPYMRRCEDKRRGVKMVSEA